MNFTPATAAASTIVLPWCTTATWRHQHKDAVYLDLGTILLSGTWVSPSIRFVELAAGLDQSWHHATARQIVVVLSGAIEVGTSDNQKASMYRTDFIADDLTGKGHVTPPADAAARRNGLS
jgi:hypothetical protein